MNPTVFIVDDNPSFLSAAARLLRASGFSVRPFNSGPDFLAQLEPGTPGCALVDLQMPEMSGLELQAALARTRNAMPIIFLTGHGDIPSAVRAMREGAEDFLEKRAPKEKLLEVIRRAIARDMRERATRARTQEVQARLEKLSDREREVLEHVLRGAAE